MAKKEKDYLKVFNVKGIAGNAGVEYERILHPSFKNKTGKLMKDTERKKVIHEIKESTEKLIQYFSDAECL